HLTSSEPTEGQPWLAVDHSRESKFYGRIYMSWTRFEIYGSKDPAHKSHIYFSRSRDGGKTFSPCFKISDKPGSCRDDTSTGEGAMPAARPNREGHLLRPGPERLILKKSTERGVELSHATTLAKNSA